VVCTFDEKGNVKTKSSDDLIAAINKGELKAYIQQAIETVVMKKEEWLH